LANVQVRICMAYLFRRFDVEVMSEVFPQQDVRKPGLGITGPARGQDMIVRLRAKTP
jgi:cytochrome P450